MTCRVTAPLLLVLLAATIGCEAPELPSAATAVPAPAVEEAAPVAEEPPMVAGAPGQELPEDETPVTDIPRKFNSHDPIKGRRSRRAGGAMGAAANARFYAEFQMMILNVDHANQLFWAEKGDWPNSHEEFMKQIIEFNQVQLPEIPEDEEYVYVPEQGELGLQIRLKPGSPRSMVPAGTSPEDAIRMLGGGEEGVGDGVTAAPAPAPDAEPVDEEPSPDIRTRAGQLGEQRNEDVEEEQGRAIAPGGVAPAGGLGEGEF